ncbi:MAG TPA: polyprenyl synthetase family protein [Candidatus Polarisedimenticolia bacterium]|jgi:geranylgeranyl pyrophosphate synthase|nr:polyprenyl synthetase family protein [Candidatus Polarisedimenticolia bacterium]
MPPRPASPRFFSLAPAPPAKVRRFLEEHARLVDREMDRLLPAVSPESADVAAAMRYTALAPGKRLRPILALAVADLYRAPRERVVPAACALEMVHACSLILDDLPCMDDAATRRGRPANHRVHGEATAVLAAFALLNLAYGILSGAAAGLGDSIRAEAGRRLSLALGTDGMIGGQALDLAVSPSGVNLDRLEKVHSRKTGSLFIASVEVGAILGGAPEKERSALAAFAKNLGLAYQIVDDLLDATGSIEQIGKPVHADPRGNFVDLAGVEGARHLARELADCAVEHLSPLGNRSSLLRGLASELIHRER